MSFSSTSFWNQSLPADVPLDPDSDQYVASLLKQVEETSFGASFKEFSASVFYATASTPTQAVTIDQPEAAAGTSSYYKDLAKIMEAVPIPPQTRPPGPWPGDNHVVIVRRNLDGTLDMWEFWKLSNLAVDGPHSGGQAEGTPTEWLNKPGWHCEAGAGFKDVAKNQGFFDDTSWPGIEGTRHFSASASGLPLAGGVLLPAEAQRRYIPHALSFTGVGADLAKTPRYPATKADGLSEDQFAVQEGMCFRFPANHAFSAVQDPVVKAICVAIRDYGKYCIDRSQSVSLKCANESTVANSQAITTDPWKGPEAKFGSAGAIWSKFLSGAPGGLFEEIPLEDLQVVDPSYRPSSVAPGMLARAA